MDVLFPLTVAVNKIQNPHLEMFERACGAGCPPGSAGRMLGLLTHRDNLIPRRRRLMHGENCLELQICAFCRLHDLCNTPTAFKRCTTWCWRSGSKDKSGKLAKQVVWPEAVKTANLVLISGAVE